jgi:maltose alpha-D-glucosyltransferase/alpha-amylase
VLDLGNDAVLGLRYDIEDSAVIVLNNLSRRQRAVTLDLPESERATATDLFADRRYESMGTTGAKLRLPGFGYRWMRLGGIY